MKNQNRGIRKQLLLNGFILEILPVYNPHNSVTKTQERKICLRKKIVKIVTGKANIK